eukprot:5094344-Pleurochrysis_carterae.AAC.2
MSMVPPNSFAPDNATHVCPECVLLCSLATRSPFRSATPSAAPYVDGMSCALDKQRRLMLLSSRRGT